jgi:hypothetical protein
MADYHFKAPIVSKGRDHDRAVLSGQVSEGRSEGPGAANPYRCRAGYRDPGRAALPGPVVTGLRSLSLQVTGPTLSLPIGKDSEYPAAPSPLTPSRRRMIGPGPAWAGPGPGCLFLLQYPPRHPNLTQARPSG